MKRIATIALAASIVLGGGAKTKVHTFGDSTCSTYAESTGKSGWGQLLQNIFDSDLVECHNWAKSGATAGTFYQKQWPTAKASIEAGDYVFIQFGHNDQKVYTEDLAGPKAYVANLKTLISAVQALDATPILVTSICRNLWTNDTISLLGRHDTRAEVNAETMPDGYDYPQIMRELATELGLYCLDMTTATKDLFEEIRQGKTTTLFASGDASHTNSTGSDINTRLCGQLIKSTLPADHELVQALIEDNIVVPDLVDAEEYVNTEHTWTFDSYGKKTNYTTLTCQDGLYLRPGSKPFTGIASSPTLSFPDGTTVKCSKCLQFRPQELTLTSRTTAGEAVTDETGNSLAFNAAVPGTMTVAIRAINVVEDRGRLLRVYFKGASDDSYTIVQEITENDCNAQPSGIAYLTYTSTEEGVFYIGSQADYYVYAVRFVPTPYIDLTWSGLSDYATFYSSEATYRLSDVALTKDDAPGEAYVVSGTDTNGSLVFSQLMDNVIPAGTAVLLKGAEGETYRLMQTTGATYSGTNLLHGFDTDATLQPTEPIDGTTYVNYILSVVNGQTAFRRLSAAGSLAAQKAYLQLPQASASRKVIVIGSDSGTTTAIATVPGASALSTALYNLNGQRIAAPVKGIYVKNGKKLLKR